jgi:hypothetical protein
VDDALVVEVGEALEGLPDKDPDERLLEGAIVAEQRRHGPAGDVLEENVEVAGVDGRV